VKTKLGATAVQIVWSSRRGARNIGQMGSAHDDAELEALKAAAGQRIAAGQLEFDRGLAGPGPAGPLPITSSRMAACWTRPTAATGSWACRRRPMATRSSGSWCSPGSSSRLNQPSAAER